MEPSDEASPPCLVVEVEGERFGIETGRIRTVIGYSRPTPIPGRRSPFIGALTLHGELLPVAPLAVLLGWKPRVDPIRSAVVIVDWDDALLGLLVDRTHGLLTPVDRVRVSQVLGRWEGPHLAHTLEVESRSVHVLDLDSLLADVSRRLE